MNGRTWTSRDTEILKAAAVTRTYTDAEIADRIERETGTRPATITVFYRRSWLGLPPVRRDGRPLAA